LAVPLPVITTSGPICSARSVIEAELGIGVSTIGRHSVKKCIQLALKLVLEGLNVGCIDFPSTLIDAVIIQ
jgi:hypothetical protein